MKKIYFLLLLSTGIVSAQIVNIPDANFKAALILLHPELDPNSDGEIEFADAALSTELQLGGYNISDLTGIEAFTGLQLFTISSPFLTGSLDLTMLPNLTNISINNTALTAINVSGITGLKQLDVSHNQLTSINVSGLSELLGFQCFLNNLTSIDISSLSSLTQIDFGNTPISSIDLSTCPLLQFVYSSDTLITTLDLSQNPNVSYVWASNNTNLVQLLMKNGHSESNITLAGSNNLQFVCCDESDLAAMNTLIAATGIAATASSYCSFVLGGDYNTITGNFLFDTDNNGCGTGDYAPPFIRVEINDGSNSGAAFTNQGNYSFFTQAGNFTITPQIENPTYFSFSPATSDISFPVVDNSTTTQNFCITANGIHPDVEVVLVPLVAARPGFDAIYKIVFRNKGNQTVSGNIQLAFNDNLLDFVSAVSSPNVITTGNLLFNYLNLLPFENRQIIVTLHVHSFSELPSVNIGDILHLTTTANNSNDGTPGDNTFILDQVVVSSHDPNIKTCLEGNTVSPLEIGNYLHYSIHFENMGTADALNIVVKDTIDATKFDISSLQIMNASHPVNVRVTGNIVEFIFENINLPPSAINPIGGHGNVLFKIKTLPGLAIGTEVSNTAGIYFDYNAPISTNTARTTFAALRKTDFKKDDSIRIYPNPAKNSVHITAKNNITNVALFDIEGRILETAIENKNAIILDISKQADGIYFLKVITADGSITQKIIKE